VTTRRAAWVMVSPALVAVALFFATLHSYRELFGHREMARHFGNSLLLASATTLLSLGFNVTAGYAFAKLPFAGRDAVFKLLLGIMLIPAQVAMIPLFLMLKQLGLVNSYVGVLLPSVASIFGIFLVRQYALTVPDAMLEAARLEGASEFASTGPSCRRSFDRSW